jgi:hypothetical protein
MRDWKNSWLIVLSFVLTLGCGAGAEKKPSVAPSSHEKASEDSAPALTPAPAPADLVGVMRLTSPGALADTLGAWINLPEWRGALRGALGDEDAAELERVFSFEAPVEAAAMLDPRASSRVRVFFAVSFGLASFDGALSSIRSAGMIPERLPSGDYTVRLKDKHDCAVARSLGATKARFVCANNARALEALLSYMARGLPNESLSKSQLHLEARAEPFRRRYGKNTQMLKLGVPFVLRELSIDNPRFDAALSDAAYALAEELIALSDDLDVLALDGTIDSPAEALDLSLSLKFRGQKSWISGSIAAAVHDKGSAPEAFWSLPRDATLAGYQRPSDPQRNEKLAAAVSELANGALDYAGIGSRLRESAASALKQALLSRGGYIFATGPADSSAPASTEGKPSVAAIRSSMGYYLSGIEDDGGKLAELIRQWAAVYGDPAFTKTLKARKVELDKVPAIKSRRVSAAEGLPSGSMSYDITLPKKLIATWLDLDLKEATPLTIYVVVADTGERSWLGISADEKLIHAKLRSVLKPAEGATLTGREGIAKLRSTEAVSAGFMTLRYLVDRKYVFDSKSAGPSFETLVSKLPHRGETPILYRSTISSDGREVSWTLSTPRAVFEDVVGAILISNEGN